MLLDVILESLRFLGRDDLDACQLASKQIRNFIQGSSTLPLRFIRAVSVGHPVDRPYMKICRSHAEHDVEPWQDATQVGDVDSLGHLRNAYIKLIALHAGAERCVPILSGASDALNFKVGRMYYYDNLQEAETLQRSVDWIVRDLRVTDYKLEMCGHNGDENLLPTTLTHHSVRATAEYIYVLVYHPSPASVLLERLFGLLFDVPKLAAVLRFAIRDGQGTEFAERFIRRFIAANDVSRIARSVTIVQWDTVLPEMCVAPRQRNIDAPKTRLLEEHPLAGRYVVQKGDLYVFKNIASGRELRLLATTAHAVCNAPENNVEDLFVISLTID